MAGVKTRGAARWRLLLSGTLVASAACGGGGGVSRSARVADARPLAGVWDGAFTLDAPPLGFDTAALRGARQGRVRGTFAFLPNHVLTAAVATGTELAVAPSLYGTYDVDFTPFGFDVRRPDRVPDLVGVAAAGDSVLLLLSPSDDRAQVLLAGTFRRDSLVGTWRLQSAGRGSSSAGGHFVLVAPATARPAGRR